MSNDLPVPDFLNIGADTQAAAQAAMNQSTVLKVPEDATVTTSKKTGETYYRWSEAAVIDGTWRETTKTGLVAAVVQVRIRVGSVNGGARQWARHILDLSVLAGTADEETKGKHGFMNDKAINAITTLLLATGLAPESCGISGKLLNYLFPVKNAPGVTSPLRGKAVILNLCDQPNTGKDATTPRQTQVESYLPDTPEEK